MRAALAVLAALLSTACAHRYDEFRLPLPPPGEAAESFQWEVRPQPVLARGPDPWDRVDALNPSIIPHRGELLNLYSGFDGTTWHTGWAISPDGLEWQKRGKILSPDPATWEGAYIAANGAVMERNGSLLYWYQAGQPPRIGLAVSEGAGAWRKRSSPVLGTGPLGSWDEFGIGDPYVIEAGGELFMYFVGMDRARRQRLGVARSADGVQWLKLRTNPILEIGADGAFDENGLGEPAVWTAGGRYLMLYTGRDRHENRAIGAAESPDGVRWTRTDRIPVLAGEQPWNRKVICDPTVLPGDGGWHVWFGGGDVASPDERLNGQIGYAFLRARR
jgi:predicted GH43/DUF377 family glycosyl hydrolase